MNQCAQWPVCFEQNLARKPIVCFLIQRVIYSVNGIASDSIKLPAIGWERKLQQVLFSRTEKHLTPKGKENWFCHDRHQQPVDSLQCTIYIWCGLWWILEGISQRFFCSCVDDLVSVGVPFLGDYVGLRRNPLWKDTLKRNRLHRMDRRVVFADILNKINRSNGKV